MHPWPYLIFTSNSRDKLHFPYPINLNTCLIIPTNDTYTQQFSLNQTSHKIEFIFIYKFFLSPLQKMDINRDGVVTMDEFLDCCRNDDAISRSMAVFDTSIWPDPHEADDSLSHSAQQVKGNSRSRSSAHKNHCVRHHQHKHSANHRQPPSTICCTQQNCTVHLRPSSSVSNNSELQLHVPGSPSLVKVKAWYTVAKQGVSC